MRSMIEELADFENTKLAKIEMVVNDIELWIRNISDRRENFTSLSPIIITIELEMFECVCSMQSLPETCQRRAFPQQSRIRRWPMAFWTLSRELAFCFWFVQRRINTYCVRREAHKYDCCGSRWANELWALHEISEWQSNWSWEVFSKVCAQLSLYRKQTVVLARP